MLTLLTVLAASFAYTMRLEVRLAQYSLGSAQARALAEAAVHQAAFELHRELLLRRWPVDGTPQRWEFAGGEVQLNLLDQSGLIDLNLADPRLLDGLLLTAGGITDPQQRAALVDAIQDWHDTDSEVRLNGAEDDAYEQAGKPYGAKNAPFASVEELQQVLGIDLALYHKLAGALTVFGLQSGVNPLVAPAIVLNALPGADAAAVQQFIALRETTGSASLTQNLPGVDPLLLSGQSQFVYRLWVRAKTERGGTAALEAVITVPPGGIGSLGGDEAGQVPRLFAVLAWQELWLQGDDLSNTKRPDE